MEVSFFPGKVGDGNLIEKVELDVLFSTSHPAFCAFPGGVSGCDKDLALLLRMCHYHDLVEPRNIHALSGPKFGREGSRTFSKL